MKKTQAVMVWLLPLIVIGGLFYPLLGYLVVVMMAILLTLSIFKGRYWCGHLCPRGAFLDIVISKMSFNKTIPRSFGTPRLRWTVFYLFLGFLLLRIIKAGGNLAAVGAIFVGMCLLTTIIAILLGVVSKHRGWCVVCPMGTLQEKIFKISGKKQEN